jgi:hypothetical protein
MKTFVQRVNSFCDLLGAALLTTAIGVISVAVLLTAYLIFVHLPVVIPVLGICFLLGCMARAVFDL